MRYQEIDRLEVIQALEAQRTSQITAATKLGLSTRQVRRLQKRYQMGGITGLISQHRGKKATINPVLNLEKKPLN